MLGALDAAGREDDADDAAGFLVSGDASPSSRLDGKVRPHANRRPGRQRERLSGVSVRLPRSCDHAA
jgi:hypothetical protein